ncbi:zinc finger A20 and AN1 domain-containing stress-associated protein 1 [Citrus sinensis]|uniref:AN1-type domain-containing protein n=3 Tax=Citrus TaxID=2706 RepID=A0A067FGV4_CITSI|nr:zinc finger A20 and AN1 domain-containing stress-associated protein 10-like [Citrus sinensis]ESR35002.1 hypothetical protein CICLE_v10006551mg [Citrus x clementina]KAH9647471.1 zinc finger A20 and AN1 domain-containing stress-associated protein 1 [Citrus sinensis]KDO65370.1 hypothetical protein CISIN_1g038787mg [Citrus sinensis]
MTPPLCAKGCGFYGTKEHKSMCSKCYNDFLEEQVTDGVVKRPLKLMQPNPSILVFDPRSLQSPSCSSSERTTIDSAAVECSSGKTTSALEKRCEICDKKVGSIELKCRCGHLYCGTHRYPKEHACTFDFKKFDRETLVEDDPLIRADKLEGRI